MFHDMIQGYSKNHRDITKLITELDTKTPSIMKGFNTLPKKCTAQGVLKTKTKELIALILSVLVQAPKRL